MQYFPMLSRCDNALAWLSQCHGALTLLSKLCWSTSHHLAPRAKCKKLAPYWLLIKRAAREWLIDGRWQEFGLIATCQPPLFGILSPPRIIFAHFKRIELPPFASRPSQLLFNQTQISCRQDKKYNLARDTNIWNSCCQKYRKYQNKYKSHRW